MSPEESDSDPWDRNLLLDDEIVRVALDHGLEFFPLVSWDDEESAGILVDTLVFIEGEEDSLRASGVGALADEAAFTTAKSFFECEHLLVDGAKDRLVVR
jgi:hypothetical protein